MNMRKLVSYLVVLTTYMSFVGQAALPVRAQIIGKAMEQKMKDLPVGLQFRLSEGVEGAEKRVKETLPSTDLLSSGDANSLLKRLPDIKTDKSDQVDFAK